MAGVYAVIVAAGRGARMGAAVNKVLLPLCGKPVLRRTAEAFVNCPGVDGAVVVAAREELAQVRQALDGLPGIVDVVPGGDARQRSVRSGLSALPADVLSRERLHGGANITNIYYDLCMRTFDPATRTFSAPRTLLDGASAKLSVSLPRVSPDGRWLVFAAGHCGQFHIWHRDADLWIVDLTTLRARPCTEINSSDAESYHCFSSDGRWMVFSSRRDDGAYTRPYLAAFDPATGTFGHPFLLPVEDPAEHGRRMLSYNVPEFSSGRVRMSPRRLRQAASGRIRPTKWTGNAIIAP